MSKKRPGLGKGLDALIPQGGFEPAQPQTSGVVEVNVTKIIPNPRQPRSRFDAEALASLADSIKEHGIIQPVIVSQGELPDQFILIAGERRLLAAKQAGMETVPVIVRETSDQGRLEMALVENVQRSDLSPLETAEAFRQLSEDFGLSHEEIGLRVGKSRVSVTNTIRLLNLPPSIQEALTNQIIREGHARALLGLPTPQSQAAVLSTIVGRGLNVRQTEDLVRKFTGEKPKTTKTTSKNPEIKALEEQLRNQLGTRVILRHSPKGGSITIHYYSDEELDTLLSYFQLEE